MQSHTMLTRSSLPTAGLPARREASIDRSRGRAEPPPKAGRRPLSSARRMVTSYRLTWMISIATALGSGYTFHHVLYEEEDGPSPAATFAAVAPARATGSVHVPGHVPGHVLGHVLGDASAADARQAAQDQQTKFLVRSTLMALDDANRSGNYTVLRDLAGPRFQARNSALRLRQVFEAFRDAGVDLSHASLVEPRIDKRSVGGGEGVLTVDGHVPGPSPDARQRVRYAMEFEPVQGHWRLLTLSVGIEPTGRDAPAK